MPKSRTIELHFQEFFAGEAVEIRLNGKQAASFTAKTRTQIGLAHIEKVEVSDGDKVEVRVAGAGEKSVSTVKDVTVYIVRLSDKTLTIEPARESPTYM